MSTNDKKLCAKENSQRHGAAGWILLLLLVGCGGLETEASRCELPAGTVSLVACKNQRDDCLGMSHYDAGLECDQVFCECELQDKAPLHESQPQ